MDNATLAEIIRLLEAIQAKGMSTKDVIMMLESSDSAAILTGLLNEQPFFPHQWKDPVFYAFKNDHPEHGWIQRVELPEDGLSAHICLDCGSHVWVEIGGLELHLSVRMTDFVQLTPQLQVRPRMGGIYVRRLRPMQILKNCLAASD